MTNWPPSLISFDVWRTMTLYDPEKDDGGPDFQRLMGLLLMHPGTYEEGAYDGSYWLANEARLYTAIQCTTLYTLPQCISRVARPGR